MKISTLPPAALQSAPTKAKGIPDPVDRFVRSLPGLRGLSGPKIAIGCWGACMGAIPVAGAGVNMMGGLFNDGTPEGTGMVGMLANLGGVVGLLSSHPVIGGVGLAVSATTAFMFYTDDNWAWA